MSPEYQPRLELGHTQAKGYESCTKRVQDPLPTKLSMEPSAIAAAIELGIRNKLVYSKHDCISKFIMCRQLQTNYTMKCPLSQFGSNNRPIAANLWTLGYQGTMTCLRALDTSITISLATPSVLLFPSILVSQWTKSRMTEERWWRRQETQLLGEY